MKKVLFILVIRVRFFFGIFLQLRIIKHLKLVVTGSGFGEPAADPAILEVHEHVEAIVEQLLGDSIDNTTLDPLCRHPECEHAFNSYSYQLKVGASGS